MELIELKQLIEKNARVILRQEQRLIQLSSHSIIEGTDRIVMRERLKSLEQEVWELKNDLRGRQGNLQGWG